jgi:hypothetical protein
MDINYDKGVRENVKAQKLMIVSMLKSSGEDGVTTKDFKARNIHHTDRISKLRKDGYVIECEKLDSGNYKYTLVSEPEEQYKHKTSLEKFIENWNMSYPSNKLSKKKVETILDNSKLNIVTKKGGFKA